MGMIAGSKMAELSHDELTEIAHMGQLADVGKRLRESGEDCAHVYFAWSPGESDLEMGGDRCEAAIFLTTDDVPKTARMKKSVVVVDDGW